MPAAPSGEAGFVTRHQTAMFTAVAALTGIATAGAASLAWLQGVSPIGIAALAGAAILVAAVNLWNTRHLGLAILAAVMPLPGLVWAAPLSSGSEFGLIPFLAYGFAAALATLYAQHVLDRTVHETESAAPWRAAGLTLALTGGLAALWFWKTANADAALQAVADTAAASISTLLLLPLSVALVDIDETAIAEANRARERRTRICARLAGAAEPRWGLSLSGIVLILLALGWFGAGTAAGDAWWRLGATVLVSGGVFGAVAGGWREGLALALVAATTCLLALWWRSYGAGLPCGAVTTLQVAALAGFIGLAVAGQMRQWRSADDPPETVRRRALENASGSVFAALAAAVALLPGLIHIGAVAIIVASLTAGLAGALLFPAVVTGIETLAPRRLTADEAFRKQ